MNFALGLLLAYFFTGCEMLICHIDGDAVDRPAYVDGPFSRKLLVGAIWPYVCKLNGDLNWFLCGYLGFSVVSVIYLALVTPHISYFWSVVILCAIRPLPVLGKLFNILSTTVSGSTFAAFSLIFGWKIPDWIQRFKHEQQYREQQRLLHKQFRRFR